MKGFRTNSIALWICAVFFCTWGYVLDLKYYNFGYWGWDLPLYANVMWNLCHGSLKTSLFGCNFLSDHFNGIAFLLVPFYYFFQSALTLLYFKLLAFIAGAYVFYLLASKRLGNSWGLAFMLAYLFYFPNIVMIFFEFNFENLVLPLFFLLFYYFEEKRFMPFMVCCFLTTIIKENMPLVVLMFGFYGLLMRREDWVRWGLLPLVLGGMMFWGEIFVIIPWLRHDFGSQSGYWGLYTHVGHSPQGIFKEFLYNQGKVIQLLFTGSNTSFLLALFGPMLITALLSPQILFLALPLFLQDLLSQFPGQHSMDYFYASTLTVFIFMATVDFLGRINAKYRVIFLGVIVVLLSLFDIWFIPQWCSRMPSYDEKQAAQHYLLSKIPPNAKVFSTYNFLYFLTQRKDLYVFDRARSPFTRQKYQVPKDLDYAIVDFSTRGDNKASAKRMLSQEQWTVQAAADDVILLRKNTGKGERLIESGEIPLTAQMIHPDIILGDVLRLDAVEFPSSLRIGSRIMRVVFYWKALKNDSNKVLPQLSLKIFQGQVARYSKKRKPFYGLPFNKNEYDKDTVYYFIPKLDPGDYSVEIQCPVSSGQIGTFSRITRSLRILPI